MNTKVYFDIIGSSNNPNGDQVVSEVNSNTGTALFHYLIPQSKEPQPGTSIESEVKRVLKGLCSPPKPAKK